MLLPSLPESDYGIGGGEPEVAALAILLRSRSAAAGNASDILAARARNSRRSSSVDISVFLLRRSSLILHRAGTHRAEAQICWSLNSAIINEW